MRYGNHIVPLTVAAFALCMLTSCNKVDPEVAKKTLYESAKISSYFGLKQWSTKDAPAAKECAKALVTNIDTALMPYFDGGKLPSSLEVQQLLNSSLFKNVIPEVKAAIVAASVALDVLLPVPDAKTYLTQEQVDYIKSFLKGARDGCNQFLDGGNKAEKEFTQRKWLN